MTSCRETGDNIEVIIPPNRVSGDHSPLVPCSQDHDPPLCAMKLPDHKSPQQQEDAVHTSTLKKPPPILTFTPPTGVVREGWHGQREPLSPLDQIRPLPQKKLFTFAEPWMEEEEDDDNELFAMTNRLTLTTDSSLQRFKGDGLLSFSYNVIPPSPFQDAAGSSFFSAFSNPLNSSFNIPFLTSPSKDKSSSFLYPTTSRSPNKAIVTINASTSIIMVVNKVANEMFGYRPGQLIGTKIQGLFAAPYQSTQRALTEQHINESGETVLVSGKVMDAITSTGIEFPVSVWMRKVISADEPRVIVVIEPVERCSAYFTINKEGHVVSCDSTFITLFGFDDVDEVVGRNLSLIIPSFSLDKISENQSLTGRTSDGSPFPLTLSLAPQEPPQGIIEPNKHEEDSPSSLWDGMVLVYASLSGMISFFSDGTIHGCNRHFSSMLLGYAQNELIGKDISQVIPDFYSLIQLSISDMWSNNENLSSSIFQSVSETCFDVPLTSISEENEVFVDPLTSSNNTPCHIKEKRDDSFYTSDKDYDDDKDYCDDKEIVIQFKPSVVTIGGVVYNYDESGSDEEVFDVSAGDFLCQENVSSSDDQCDIVSVAQVITNECDVTSIDPEAQTDSTQSHSMTSETQTDSTQSHSMTSETQTNVHPETQTDSTQSHSITSETQTNVHPETQTDSTQSHSMTSETQTKTTSDPPFFDHHYQPSSSSTPAQRESRPTSRLSSNYGHENLYSSYASHKDGSLLSIIFQFKQIPLAGAIEDGRSLFCIWVMRDNDSIRLKSNDISKVALCSPQSPLEVSSEQLEEQLAVVGEYGLHYDTLGPVGSGAFGFVKLATRRRDNQMVIVKFIRKATVIPEHWVEHETMGLIPREICILAQISHVNVVQLLEAYENEHYFQLVMDKHGDGMDLFTFIESGPYLDEALISYMFRQVVAGLDYLHKRCILHRDVKDENIILNHNFHMKLIDFGSAAYMKEGTLFNTFCGTLEYCSPEVLMGNSYAGPELEMWSLGVTLYTIVYGENPFFDVEEIIAGHLQPPFLVSPGLLKTVLRLLHPDPKSRATLTDLQHDPWVNQQVDVSNYSFNAIVKGGGNAAGESKSIESELKLSPDLNTKRYLLTRTLT